MEDRKDERFEHFLISAGDGDGYKVSKDWGRVSSLGVEALSPGNPDVVLINRT